MFCHSTLPYKIAFLLIVKVLACGLALESASAQGQLSRARQQVRKSDHHDEEEHKKRQQKQKKSQSGSSGKSSGFTLNLARSQARKKSSHSGHAHQKHDPDHHRRRHRNHGYNSHHGHHGYHGHGAHFYANIFQPVIYEPPCFHPPVYCEPPIVSAPCPPNDEFLLSEPIIDPAYPPTPVYASPVEESAVVVPCASPIVLDEFETWSARGSLTIGSDFDDLTQGSLALLFQEPGGLGLDIGATTLRESGMNWRDHLWLGDVNLVIEAANSSYSRLRIGAGVNWLADSYGGDAGFNLTAGIDLKLTDRLILSAEGDIGTLGDSDYWHGRVNFARRIGNAEWLVGFDHYDIGGVNFHNIFTKLVCPRIKWPAAIFMVPFRASHPRCFLFNICCVFTSSS